MSAKVMGRVWDLQLSHDELLVLPIARTLSKHLDEDQIDALIEALNGL